jgi:hypothetical protein
MWKKRGRRRQANDGDMSHVHCMLDIQGYKHTLKISNTYGFIAAIMVE